MKRPFIRSFKRKNKKNDTGVLHLKKKVGFLKPSHRLFTLSLIGLLLSYTSFARAYTLTWNGSQSTSIYTLDNWNLPNPPPPPNHVPDASDLLIFPIPTTATLPSNNISPISQLGILSFNDAYTFTSTVSNLSLGSFSGVLDSTFDIGSTTLTVTNANIATGFYGNLTGTHGSGAHGSLILSGGNLNLLNTNTYTGPTTIQNGSTLNTLNLGATNAHTSALTFGSGGGKIEFGSSTSSSIPITLTGPATISTNTYDVTLSGGITGNGQSLTKLGPGTLTLRETNSNAGPLTLSGGTLNLDTASLGSISSILFLNFGSTLQAGSDLIITQPVTLSANGYFDTNGNTITINGPIGGSQYLVKTGAGTLTLTAVNSYTGNTIIQEGTLNAAASSVPVIPARQLVFSGDGSGIFQLSSAFPSFASDIILMDNGTIDTNGFNMTASGVVAGLFTNSLTKMGSGTLTLSGDNIYLGDTNVTGGTLQAGSSSTLTTGPFGVDSPVTLSTGTTLDLNNFNASIGSLSGPASSFVTLGSGTLNFTEGNNSTFSGVVSGTGGITNTLGTQTLSGTNTYSGPTTVNGGTLRAAANNALGNGSSVVTVNNDAVLSLQQTQNNIASLTMSSSSTLQLSVLNTITHGELFASGTANLDGTLIVAALPGFQMNIGDHIPLINAAGGHLQEFSNHIFKNFPSTINPQISYSDPNIVSLFVAAPPTGVLTWVGDVNPIAEWSTASNWTPSFIPADGDSLIFPTPLATSQTSINDIGALTLDTVAINQNYTIDSSTAGYDLTVNTISSVIGSTLDMGANTLTITNGDSSTNFSGILAGAGGSLVLKEGTLNLKGTNSYTGTTTIEGESTLNTLNLGSTSDLIFDSGGGMVVFLNDSNSTAKLTLHDSAIISTKTYDVTLSNLISGNGSTLTKQGSGTLTLSGANSNAGPISINEGTLNLNSAALESTTRLTFAGSGGILQAAGPLSVPPILLNADGTIDTNNFDVSAPADITSSSSLNSFTKKGSGTLTLSGDNTYTGPTNIFKGTLQAGSSSTTNAGPFGVNSALTLRDVDGSGETLLDLNNLDVSIGSLSGASDVPITLGSGTLNFTQGNGSTFSGVISGTGGITNTSGIQTLAGINTYSGPTKVKGGMLLAGSNNALGNGSSAVTINGGTLDLQQTQNLVSSLNMSSNGKLQTEVSNTSNYGRLNVSGSANLGGTLIVHAFPDFNMDQTETITLVNALGGLSGTQFASTIFRNFSGEFIPQITYTATDVLLGAHKTVPSHTTGSHTEVVFTGFHQQHLYITRKCCQLRSRLFATQRDVGMSEEMDVASDNSEPYLTEASPSSSSSKATASLGGSTSQEKATLGGSSALQRRIAAVQRPATFSSGPAYTYCNEIDDTQIYASSLYSTGSVETRGDQAGFNYDSIGGLVGFDRFFADQESGGWGIIAQYKRQNGRIDNNGGSTKVDQVHGNVYASYIPFCSCPYFSLNGIAGVAYAWDKMERNAGPNLSLKANARTHETLFDLLLQAEYLLSAENASWIPCNAAISPWLGAGYIYDRIAGYQESGAGIFNLAVNAQTAQSLVSSLGARFLSLWDLGGTSLLAELDLGWQHQFSNNGRTVFFTAFEVNTSPAAISTVQAGRDTLLVGLDLTASMGGGWEIEGSANYHLNDMFHDLTFYLGLNKRF